MIFRRLGLVLLFMSVSAYSQGRGPAVEDFVGIELEPTEATPHSNDSLYNLEQDIIKIEDQKKRPVKENTAKKNPPHQDLGTSILLGISLVLGFPLVLWFFVMSKLKQKASQESASNIEVLEKYRREREKKNERNSRKVS